MHPGVMKLQRRWKCVCYLKFIWGILDHKAHCIYVQCPFQYMGELRQTCTVCFFVIFGWELSGKHYFMYLIFVIFNTTQVRLLNYRNMNPKIFVCYKKFGIKSAILSHPWHNFQKFFICFTLLCKNGAT